MATHSQDTRRFLYAVRDTTDPEQHSDAMSDCEHAYEQLQRGAFRGNVAELLLGPLHIGRDRVFNPMGYSGPSRLDWHVFFSFVPAGGAIFSEGRQISENVILKYRFNESLRAFSNGPLDCVSIAIRNDAVREEFARSTGAEVSPALLNDALCVLDPALVDRFRREVVDALALADSDPDRVADERWQDSLRRGLSQLLFEIVQSGSPVAELLPPPSTRGYIVEKSIEYMRAHLVSIDGLADVCRHVRVSPRTLRYSFEEILGVPPLHYLLMLKLRGIRAELQQGAGANGIHRVAERYGFCHMGRFALFYQQAFGERPSETCRQAAATRARAGRVRRAVRSCSHALP